MTDIASIHLWHKRARPEPTNKDFQVQLGCHIEEFLEMLEAVPGVDQMTINAMSQLKLAAHRMADGLKSGRYSVWDRDRIGLCDAMADQIVTAVGVMYCAKMDVVRGMGIVNTSNWSKFDSDGQPLRDANGKIKKGPNYVPPHLDECV